MCQCLIDFAYQAQEAPAGPAGAKPGESHSERNHIPKWGWEGCYHERNPALLKKCQPEQSHILKWGWKEWDRERNPALLKKCRLERSHILRLGWEGWEEWDRERNPALLKKCQPVLKLGYQELMAFLAPWEHHPFAGSPAPLVHAQQVLALRL